MQQDTFRRLVDAGIAITSELSLDAVLQRITAAAAELTGARYAALGVIDQTGEGLERFLTHGIPEEQHERIGELPRGRGILGVLIRDAEPLRLADLNADPRAVGFPPHHPPMRTFLGVPILLRGVAYGNLYLTEKEGGAEFDGTDQELVTLLAAQAAVAIENARLYESATRWSRQLESLNEIGAALASELDLQPLLNLVASRLRELVDARLVSIALPIGEGRLQIAAADGDGADALHGAVLDVDASKSGRVFQRGRSERVDSVLEDPEIDRDIARQAGARTGLYVPLIAADRPLGVLAIHDRQGRDSRFTQEHQRIAEGFAQRAAVAVELSGRVASDALRRIVEAQELERKRLARELHDETGQALTSVLLRLKAVEEARSPEEARAATAELRELIVGTLQNVRRLAVELRPKALDDFGLVAAVDRLAETFTEQTGIAVDFHSALTHERLPTELETAVYRIVQEALTNVVKHAGAKRVSILLTERNGALAAIVEDDGQGFEARAGDGAGLGLIGMRERVGLLGGWIGIESTQGAGTTLIAEVPLR